VGTLEILGGRRNPSYPLPAQLSECARNRLVLQASIGQEGNVEDVQVISGPAMLTAAALERRFQTNGTSSPPTRAGKSRSDCDSLSREIQHLGSMSPCRLTSANPPCFGRPPTPRDVQSFKGFLKRGWPFFLFGKGRVTNDLVLVSGWRHQGRTGFSPRQSADLVSGLYRGWRDLSAGVQHSLRRVSKCRSWLARNFASSQRRAGYCGSGSLSIPPLEL
jgi:hypothetical protein